MTETLLSPRQVAGRLGVHRGTVYRWIDAGQLPCVRLPSGTIRVAEAELERLLYRDQLEAIRQHVPAGELGDGRMLVADDGRLFLRRADGAVFTLDGEGVTKTVTHPDGSQTAAVFVNGREVATAPGGRAA